MNRKSILQMLSALASRFFLFGLLAVMLCAASCADSSENGGDDNNVVLRFTLALPAQRQAIASRANTDWGDYDPRDYGTEAENTIDLKNLHVFLYNDAGNVVARGEQLSFDNALVEPNGTRVYQVSARMDINPEQVAGYRFSGRVAVFANMPAPASASRLSSLGESSVLQYSVSDFLTPAISANGQAFENRLPMYGTLRLSDFDLSPGTRHNAGRVALLRSMAKVTVALSQAMQSQGWTLTYVGLTGNHNTRGYLLPSGYASVDSTAQMTYDDGAATQSFHPLASLAANEIGFTGRSIYLAEQDNASSPATIAVKLSRGGVEEGPYTLRFVEYTDGLAATDAAAINIVRNHWYRFVVYKGSDLRIDLRVEQWYPVQHPEIVM